MEQLISLGHEAVILRLPCSKIKIERNIDQVDIRYEKIGEALSYLKHNKIHEIALIGYLERPVIDVSKASQESQRILLKVATTQS